MSWTLSKYPNVMPVPDSRKIEHVTENLKAAEVELSASKFAEIEQAIGSIKIHGRRDNVECDCIGLKGRGRSH